MRVYDTLLKDRRLVELEVDQLSTSLDATIDRAVEWLLGRFTPSGPIMAEDNVSFIYKTIWGLHTAGRADDARALLDWVAARAVRPNGDLYFDDEHPDERDGARAYRQMTILRCAAESGHALARDAQIEERALKYFNEASGGSFAYIGDDPAAPVFPSDSNVGDTVFFGEYRLGMNDRDRVLHIADWLRSMIEQNRDHLAEGQFFWHTDAAGRLDTTVAAGAEIDRVVDQREPNQMGWVVGAAIAFLADTYDACRDRWATDEDAAMAYLAPALELLQFEDAMPVETYFFPSKCKVAWGAGRLLSVLLKHQVGTIGDIDRAYRAGRRTYIYTFLGNQRSDGSWGEAFYPIDSSGWEMSFDYRMLTGTGALPAATGYKSETAVVLSDIEITGEFLAEMVFLADGIRALRAHLATPGGRVQLPVAT